MSDSKAPTAEELAAGADGLKKVETQEASGTFDEAPYKAALAVVTGASTGIGFHTAGQLGKKGYDVVCACRNPARKKEVLTSISEWYGGTPRLEYSEIDLSSFRSVQAFADRLGSRCGGVDLLVCNAGINGPSAPQELGAQLSEDGVDVLYQTNFLSHLLLVLLLMPLLKAARGRVLSISSVAHRRAERRQFGLIQSERQPYESLYGLSKLAQIVTTEELHRRYTERHGVAFHTVNPGGVASDIWRDHAFVKRHLLNSVLVDSETAAQTVVQAANCLEGLPPSRPHYWNGYVGAGKSSLFEYWSPIPAKRSLINAEPSADARDPELARAVFEESLEIIRGAGVDLSAVERDFLQMAS